MADFWIQDDAGRVLGPVSLQVLRDLVDAKRIQGVERASRDGHLFKPIKDVPEVADLLAKFAKHEDDRVEAERIREMVDSLRGKPFEEVFQLSPDASLETYRQTFYRLVKQYHPDRLPADALQDRRLAHDELFHFLATAMVEVERVKSAPAPVSKTYYPQEFVGLKPLDSGILEVKVRVDAANAATLFTDHEMVNLARDGVFVPLDTPIPMGTTVEVSFHVESKRVVRARGRVVWDSAGGKTGRGARGVGIKFLNLSDADRAFLTEFVKKSAAAKRPS